MVLAALVTAWRLAIWPTRRSPLSVKPTTVGVVRPPSLFGTICTAPPSSTATQQLVVPKSIPTTLAIIFYRSLTRGDLDHRGAQELVAEAVAPLHLLRDRVGRDFVRRLGGDGLVDVRVEEFADRRHDLDAETFEHAAELP